MSIHIPDEMAIALASLAQATGKTRSGLAIEALGQYLDRETWQVAEIQRALEEADAEDFASEQEVEAVMKKWSGHAR